MRILTTGAVHRAPALPSTGDLPRRILAEFVGTAALVTAVVGSGAMAARLSPSDVGVELLENCLASVAALGALIVLLRPLSGAHFNPVVSVADWWVGRAGGTGLGVRDLAGYVTAQATGAVAGSVLANLMFGSDPVAWSHSHRDGVRLWLGELVATAGLVAVVHVLGRSGQSQRVPAVVAAYIGAACWFTSSTSFANPAVTLGRAFTDTFAGIAPASVPGFVVAQAAGMVAGLGLASALYPAGAPAPVTARR